MYFSNKRVCDQLRAIYKFKSNNINTSNINNEPHFTQHIFGQAFVLELVGAGLICLWKEWSEHQAFAEMLWGESGDDGDGGE